MVISNEYLKRNINDYLKNPWNYLVLDVEHLREDTQKLEWVLDIVNVINDSERLKKLCKDLNSDLVIENSILLEVIQSIYSEVPFNEDQLLRYYKLLSTLNKCYDILMPFSEIHCTLSDVIELNLLGINFSEFKRLSEENKSKLPGEYSDYLYRNDVIHSNPKSIIKEVKKIVSKYKVVTE
ncbi:MAG TPA: hypothetical protein VIO43_12200 [Lutibacter sp.]